MTEKIDISPSTAAKPLKVSSITKTEQSPAVDGVTVPHRVFVGNMTYQTRESELKEFCEHVGKV